MKYLCLGACALLGVSLHAPAQLPEPKLTALTPLGGRAGDRVTVKITGTDTDGAALHFSHPGIIAEADAKNPKQFVITLPKDLPTGPVDVRVLGKFGVSNPRRFEIAKFADVEVAPKNFTREESQEIAPPCVVNGTALAGQMQWFKIPTSPGLELVFECHALELDSRMEPLLVLFDQGGRELLRSWRQPLRWISSDDKPIFLAVRDFLSNGGPEYGYRLHIGSAQHLPPAPPETPLALWPLAHKPEPEREPNDVAHPQAIALPAEIRGRFEPARDVDAFTFEAKKDEVWWVECVSNRLGQPTHPRVVIEPLDANPPQSKNAQAAVEIPESPWFAGDPDFDGYHFDPIGRFVPKKDGTYRVTLRDIHGGQNRNLPHDYALSIRKPAPDFALICTVQPPVPNKGYMTFNGPIIAVRAGNLRREQVIAIRVMAVRRDGFSGAIQLSAEGLPPGISAEPCVVGTEQSEGTLLLRADAEAPKWAGSIQVAGRAILAGSEQTRYAQPWTTVWDSTAASFLESPRSRRAAEMALAIVDEPPLACSLRTEPGALECKTDGKVKIGLHIQGTSPETPALKFKPAGLPGIEKAKLKDAEIAAAKQEGEYELDVASLKLGPGTYTLWFRGDFKTKRALKAAPTDATLPLISNAITLTVK